MNQTQTNRLAELRNPAHSPLNDDERAEVAKLEELEASTSASASASPSQAPVEPVR